jgi:hypothetical protein
MKKSSIVSALLGSSAVAVALLGAIGMPKPARAADTSCKPRVEGPVAITAQSKPYTRVDLPAAGAVEQEFFVSCTVAAGQYKTLIHVRLPKPSVPQSGIVVVEPWHPGNLWPLYAKTSEYEARAGHVAVIVVGNPMLLQDVIKPKDAARYGALSLPGAGARTQAETAPDQTTEFEVLAQVGNLIKSGGLPGVRARKVILGGMSQTGAVVRNYIDFEHAAPGAKSIYDGYFPQQSAVSAYKKPVPDLDVPVLEIQGERELMALPARGFDKILYRRDDGPLYRLYEVPGMSHVATRGRGEGGATNCPGHTLNDFPTFYVYGAVLNNMIKWVDKGIAAPRIARISTSADGREVKRDEFGNALGGYRTSYLDVPTKTFHAMWANYTTTGNGPSDPAAARCDKMGWIQPLSSDQLKKLYPTHDDYVAKVNRKLDTMVAEGLMLPEDAADLRDEAKKAAVP